MLLHDLIHKGKHVSLLHSAGIQPMVLVIVMFVSLMH